MSDDDTHDEMPDRRGPRQSAGDGGESPPRRVRKRREAQPSRVSAPTGSGRPRPSAGTGPRPDTSSRPGAEGSVRCAEHGLMYDPNVFNGCVVCRRDLGEHRAQEGSQQTTWLVIGAVVAVSAAASFVMASLGQDLQLGDVPEDELTSDYGECRDGCAQSVESCDRSCKDDKCRRICLNGAESCNRKCSHAAGRLMDASAYFYAFGALPDWLDVLESMDGLREEMLQCTMNPLPARIAVKPDGAVDHAVVLAAADDPEETVECVEQLVTARSFPPSTEPYVFVGMLDPRLDGLKVLAHAAGLRIHEVDAVEDPTGAEHARSIQYEAERRIMEQKAARESALQQAKEINAARRRAEREARKDRGRVGRASAKLERQQRAYELKQRRSQKRKKPGREASYLDRERREEREAEYKNRVAQRQADDMRRQRLHEQERNRREREREIRRIDCEARRKKAIKDGTASPYGYYSCY